MQAGLPPLAPIRSAPMTRSASATSAFGTAGAVPLARAGRWGSRHLPWIAFAGLAVAALVVWLAFPTYPNYDSQYALLWAGELLDGTAPGFDDYRAPTEHPLLLPVGVLLAPFGPEWSARLFVGLCVASLLALVAALYRLGRVAAGVAGGLLAAGLIASRLNLGLLASIGFLDIPYCALVAWAAALEAERPRRGGTVWVLLGLAGLLRPEAWLLAAVYAAWVGLERGWAGRARAIAAAAVAPALWAALDLAVTGDPAFSIRHTDALATELHREKPLAELPAVMVDLLAEIVKLPVLAAGLAGVALAAALRRRALLVPAAMVVLTCFTYLVIASGGLAVVYRYLLVAALGLTVFAAFALAGWTTLPGDSRARRPWALAAAALVLAGGAYTVTHTSPGKVLSELRERERLRADLRAVLTDPTVAAARRCGPVSVPNHKLIPEVRAILELPPGGVVARSDRSRPAQSSGVAIVIDPRIERRPALNVYEVPSDGLAPLAAPAGFGPLASTSRFAAFGSCGSSAAERAG
jgi:hypothetical protein